MHAHIHSSIHTYRAGPKTRKTAYNHTHSHTHTHTHIASRSKDKKDASTASGLAFTMPEPELLDSSDDGSWSEVNK